MTTTTRSVRSRNVRRVDRAVLLVPDFTLRMDGKPTLAEMALRHHQIRQRHRGRIWMYIGVDPRQGEAEITEFEGFWGTTVSTASNCIRRAGTRRPIEGCSGADLGRGIGSGSERAAPDRLFRGIARRADDLADLLRTAHPEVEVRVAEDGVGEPGSSRCRSDIAINATPLGIRVSDPLPFGSSALARSTVVADVVNRLRPRSWPPPRGAVDGSTAHGC